MERRKEVLDQLEAEKEPEQVELSASDLAKDSELRSKDIEITALRARLEEEIKEKEAKERDQQEAYKKLEEELKAKIVLWQQAE
jgi:hypothetical protein